ncbi:hypothetical protein OG215_38840 (plasmid) [Streptomyces globisporus]|uniref:beta-ketoacyl synthase N-terminal-like domain-containing protein n=1 Tax=Streptomyces globisporus TaxID=1908 RepID=UPI002F90C25E|nr:hypothetical protein OG215_38840 [Streptomyces globisporus]
MISPQPSTSPPARTVITGASILYAGGSSPTELDQLLQHGSSLLKAVPVGGNQVKGDFSISSGPHGTKPSSERALTSGSVLTDTDLRAQAQSEGFYGKPLRGVTARATLPVRSACSVALNAVATARLSAQERADTAVVIAGNNLSLAYQSRTATACAGEPSRVRAGHLLNCFDTDALGAVGEVTGCTGEGWTIGGSSAAGTLALIHAHRLVSSGHVRRCLVVAPVNELSPLETWAFIKAGAMVALAPGTEPAMACRPFDETRRGFAAAQMAAAVVVESPTDARRRGITPLGRILGCGLAMDGRRGTAPNPSGQRAAMLTALASCSMSPADIDYVNAHATGSVLGDACEAEALSGVFGKSDHGPWVNATKALLGHGLGSAGVVEVIATLLQLNGDYCHPNPSLFKPIRSDLRFVPEHMVGAPLRYALTNSFAFSGINSSLVLGRADGEELS